MDDELNTKIKLVDEMPAPVKADMTVPEIDPSWRERQVAMDSRDARIIALDRAIKIKDPGMNSDDVLKVAGKIEEWLTR